MAIAEDVENVLATEAMQATEGVQNADDAEGRVRIRDLNQAGDLGWVVMTHGEIYAQEFGWDRAFEALVAQIVADYANDHDADREAAWIAELDGRRVGCVFCVADEPVEMDESVESVEPVESVASVASEGRAKTAKLRILLVHPDGRGLGIGGLLVDACLAFARAAGYERIRLWTNDPLVAARRLYLQRGFTLVRQEPHRSFGVDLIGQIYERRLSPESLPEMSAIPAPVTKKDVG
jgi:GNAT superfamily N-acetyltransferase